MPTNGVNNTKVWRISVGTLIALLSFLGGWGFNTLNALPDNFVRLERYKADCEVGRERWKEIRDELMAINKKIDIALKHRYNGD
ncbi:MAG: hypothetical protein KKC77_19215 [Proteobacteria bacterium]|nr:hypothetical protein [Pseudomonadota bacterium]